MTMDRQQIEQWAREACTGFEANSPDDAISGIEAIERFAALVAAAEREACAQVCEKQAEQCPPGDTDADALHGAAAAIRARGTP